MKFQTAEDVIDLVKAFEGRRILKPNWNHNIFLTVGLYYCLRFSFGEAAQKMREGLHRLYEAHGVTKNGYHETLTIFWLKIVENFLEENKAERNLTVLVEKLIETYNNSRLPLEFYSREVLFSVEARREYVKPDLKVSTPFLITPVLAI